MSEDGIRGAITVLFDICISRDGVGVFIPD